MGKQYPIEAGEFERHERDDLLPSIRPGFDHRSFPAFQTLANSRKWNLCTEDSSVKGTHVTHLFRCCTLLKTFKKFFRMFDESARSRPHQAIRPDDLDITGFA